MTDHERLWADLDAVMNGERSATILREWIDRLRSNGQDGLRVVPVSTMQRIMGDCQHGSRIWAECNAMLRAGGERADS